MTRFSRPQAPQPAFRNPLDTRRADIQTLPRYASRCWSVLSFFPFLHWRYTSSSSHLPPDIRGAVSRVCLAHTLRALHALLLPKFHFPPRGSEARVHAHLRTGRTNRPRIPALIDCQCSDPSCEQVQDSCIQSTLIPNIPVPRTSLENLRRTGLLCQSASE